MNAVLGEGCVIQAPVILGLEYCPGAGRAILGNNCIIRAFTTIYGDTAVGDDFETGHNVLVREHTRTGKKVMIGSGSVIEGHVTMGDFIALEAGVYIATHATIGSRVFIGPHAALTNDRYPLRRRGEYTPAGAIIEDNVTIGAHATILPGVRVGYGSMVGAGSVVSRDVPPWSLALGVPARVSPLPESLREENKARRW